MLALVSLFAACDKPAPAPMAPPWAMVARSIEAPAGGTESAAQRCEKGGSTCAPIAAGAAMSGEYEIRTAAGARAIFDLGDGISLEMAGEARVGVRGSVLDLAGGAFAIEAAASHEAPRLIVRAAERAIEIDRAMPASLAIRAGTEAARVVARRGRAVIGDRVEVRSGESVEVRGSEPPVRGFATALDPDLDGRAGERAAPERAEVRGFGTMTARVPGTTEIVSGVRLAAHHVSVTIKDGFARTEIEEEFANDTSRVLEGRFVFPVPPDASLSRLALWVGKDLVEGEIVERDRANAIFTGIVEDSVRPRDPALLEWVRGSELSLKVFPLPAHGSRKVVLAYEQAVAAPAGRARHVVPLSLGADRAAKVGELRLQVSVDDAIEASTPGYGAVMRRDPRWISASFAARDFTPPADFVLAWEGGGAPGEAGAVVPAAHRTAEEDRFVAVRVPITWPKGAAPPARPRRDRAVIVDVSHSQSKETLAGEAAIAVGLVSHLDPDERFVVLACDTACATYPEDGLASPSESSLDEVRAWLARRSVGGASDVAGALLAAARRLDPGGAGQVVYLGDGAPTAGEMSAETIAARVKPEIDARGVDLRLLGAGRTVDEVVLAGLARALGASYEQASDGEPLARRVEDLALAMRAPVLKNATLEAPPEMRDVYPRALPSLRVGQELLVVGRMPAGASATVRVRGDLAGKAFTGEKEIGATHAASAPARRVWAAARIAELEGAADPASAKQVVALSKEHHVLSRRTALLVLENDRMFAEFGIERTQTKAPEASGDGIGMGMHGRLADAKAGMAAFGTIPFARQQADDAPTISVPMTFGAGGLGLSGIGEGGGGRGDVSTLGHGAGEHRASAPSVRMSGPSVSGIGSDVITRIARRSTGRMRLCYEEGLRRNPDLQGNIRVTLRIRSDGSVASASSAGSTLSDAGVVSCVLSAFRGLSFPPPESGEVVATFPVTFAPSAPAPAGTWGPTLAPLVAAQPSASHQAGDEAWTKQGEDALDRLRKAAEDEGASRRRHEALVRGLLARGRFAEALTAARRFADLDPDLPRARELLAGAAAAAGEAEIARTALDAMVELSPKSADLHARAARAFEAAGDETRACAHWRSIAELRRDADDARYQALRCRARLGDRESIAREAAAIDKPGKLVSKLIAALAAGPSPAYDASASASPGEMEATVRCAAEATRCPDVVIVKPSGDVISPWSPASARSSARSIAFGGLGGGQYRTVLVGGAPDARGEVEVRAHGSTRTFRFDHGGAQTVAITTVTNPPSWLR
jgi:Ca-activated chloride channel family protein